jgi:pyrroloquinoline quinone (PQQ) biosynthesis protein C
MKQCGADTKGISRLVLMAKQGHSLKSLVRYNVAEMDQASLSFVKNSYEVVKGNKAHEIAAAFSFGREGLVPDLFTELVKDLNEKFGGTLSAFVYYLERHIQIDGEEHGPMAEQMISELCGNDETKWQEAEKAAKQALEARLALWDSISLQLKALSTKNLAQPA